MRPAPFVALISAADPNSEGIFREIGPGNGGTQSVFRPPAHRGSSPPVGPAMTRRSLPGVASTQYTGTPLQKVRVLGSAEC